MGLVLGFVSLVLLLFMLVMIARAVLDWAATLSAPAMPGSGRARATAVVYAITEPVLAPVRRVIPPLRFGGVGIDLAFIVVFLGIVVVRALLP